MGSLRSNSLKMEQPMRMQPVQQPMQQVVPVPSGNTETAEKKEWKHGICGCFDNFSLCCLTVCCPCVGYGIACEAGEKNMGRFIGGTVVFVILVLLNYFLKSTEYVVYTGALILVAIIVQRFYLVCKLGIQENFIKTILCGGICQVGAIIQQAQESSDRKKQE